MAAASPYPTTPWLRPPPLTGLLGLLLLLLLLLLVSLSPSIALAGAGAEAAGVLRQVVGGDDDGGTFFEPFNVTYDHRALILGGKRRMLVSAGLHYPRATPEVSSDVLWCFVRGLWRRRRRGGTGLGSSGGGVGSGCGRRFNSWISVVSVVD